MPQTLAEDRAVERQLRSMHRQTGGARTLAHLRRREETLIQFFARNFPGRCNLYSELSVFCQSDLAALLSDGKKRTLGLIINALILARISSPRPVADCGFCGPLVNPPPFCLLPPIGLLPPGARGRVSPSLTSSCVFERAFQGQALTDEKVRAFLTNEQGQLRLIMDCNDMGQPMTRLPEYASLLWTYAHEAGLDQVVNVVQASVTALHVPALAPYENSTSEDHLWGDFDALLRSVNSHSHSQVSSATELTQHQRHQLDQLVRLHCSIFSADFADYVMGVIIRRFRAHMTNTAMQTQAAPGWLEASANDLHKDYAPDSYSFNGQVHVANRNISQLVQQMEEWGHRSNTGFRSAHVGPMMQRRYDLSYSTVASLIVCGLTIATAAIMARPSLRYYWRVLEESRRVELSRLADDFIQRHTTVLHT